ncbi:RB-associated KRAB zinc finger protein [Coccinella septempunctata]|uniref:RB-associated KRAB zinc finger protein n=1 Tax=Coccinella septempunctata TaxID=41139 RepID=UPI001D069F42|nr:RB-associated KRAB zinc finger protein [Coccinella septempunctata]
MSGYKRVNYYELCRLCATNQQKEKTHIFQEEGRKIQLLSKIQSCLSLTVYEHDFLPKVVCSKCLKSLESYYSFRQECVSSETMLSSYFKNFRYTEDFKKSGKVYIKETTARNSDEQEVIDIITTSNQVVTSSQPIQVAAPSQSHQNASLLPNYVTITGALNETPKQNQHQNQSQLEQVQSYYTVQLPQAAIVTNQPSVDQKSQLKTSELPNKIIQHSQIAYNLNTVNLTTPSMKPQQKPQETINNVVVNANGEVINISQLVDFETIMNQAPTQKIIKTNNNNNTFKQKRVKETKLSDDPVIKIDLTDNENKNTFETNPDKLPHIKSTQNHQKFTYNNTKLDDKVTVNVNPTVIFNAVQDYQVPIPHFVPFHQNSGNISYSNQSATPVNIATSTVCSSTNNEHSTVNLNALNGDMGGGTYRSPTQFTSPVVKSEMAKSDNVVSSFKSSSNVEKLHVCDICHKSFKRREHLYQHIKLHTGFRPYTCEHCSKSFMRKEHLLRHMTSHSGQKNYTCNICEKSFSRNDNLLKHKKTHEKQNSFTCEVCQKQFVMKHYYLAHKVTHEVVDRCISQTLGILKA